MQSVKTRWFFLKVSSSEMKSYIMDTKDFIKNLLTIKDIIQNSFLVDIGVSSLHANINHEEGGDTCFGKLEERRNKSFPSIVVKYLTLIIFNWNNVQFENLQCGHQYHHITLRCSWIISIKTYCMIIFTQ